MWAVTTLFLPSHGLLTVHLNIHLHFLILSSWPSVPPFLPPFLSVFQPVNKYLLLALQLCARSKLWGYPGDKNQGLSSSLRACIPVGEEDVTSVVLGVTHRAWRPQDHFRIRKTFGFSILLFFPLMVSK